MEHVHKKLNVIINDHDGVGILSPLLQDSIVPYTNYNTHEKQFEMHLNRFAHEHSHKDALRINSYLIIPSVNAVHHKGLKREIEALNLLTLQSEEKDQQHYLYLIFSDHKTIRVTMSQMFFRLWDFGKHWRSSIPQHSFEYVLN